MTLEVTSNSDGFRNSREFDEPDARKRILVIGDSFTFGLGVRAEDRLTEQLEVFEPAWRVDNMGMNGWGLDLMIRALERYVQKAEPHVVVVAIYTSDFTRLLPHFAGVGYPLPRFTLARGELVTVPYPALRFWHRLRLGQLLYHAKWSLDPDRYDLHQALLDRFLKNSETNGFIPVVMFIPAKTTTEDDARRRHFLKQWSNGKLVYYLDLTEPMRAAGDAIYIDDDQHWNAAGHRIAARRTANLPPASPERSSQMRNRHESRSDAFSASGICSNQALINQ